MKFLRESVVFLAINLVLFAVLFFLTNNIILSLLLFAFLTLLFCAPTWLIHARYLSNDRLYQVVWVDNRYTIVRNGSVDRFALSEEHVLSIDYFRRTPFGYDKAFNEPSYGKYYFVRIRFSGGEEVVVSCLMVDPLLFGYPEFEWVKEKLVFNRMNMPFI